MGTCVLKPNECVGLSSKKKMKTTTSQTARKRRRRIMRRRVSSRNIENGDISGQPDRSYSNPAVQGSTEGAFSDPISVHELEWDDEFYSIHEDGFSVVGSESVSVPPPRDGNNRNGEARGSVSAGNAIIQEESNHCGILSNNYLPCLASTVTSLDKKKSLLCPGTPTSKRKPSLKLSFKWREGPSTPSIFSPKALLQRPVAGSSIPLCPADKKMPNCWSPIEPSTFKVRGSNYLSQLADWEFAISQHSAVPQGILSNRRNMVLCYPSTPKKLAMTIGCFVAGVVLFTVGSHFSYINVAPQQAQTKARNDFLRERLRQKHGKG